MHMNEKTGTGVSFEKENVKESQSQSVTPSLDTPSGAGLGASHLITLFIPFDPVDPPRVAKNGFRRSVNREMNRPRAVNQPVSCCTPFLDLGAGESRIALSCAGFASIPLYVTMKPKNQAALTLKAHFKGLSFMPYALRMSKASWRCVS